MRNWIVVFCFACLAHAVVAEAYIGPGSGVGLLGGLWSVLVGIFLALGAILAWPLRVLVKRFRRKSSSEGKDRGAGSV